LLKVLNISSSVGIGGREMQVMTISDKLRDRGCEVRLLTARGTWLDKKARERGYVNYNLPMKKYVDAYSIWKIGGILREYQPDVVHLYFISDIWLVVPAVKLFYPKARVYLLRCMQSSGMKDFARTRLFGALDKILVVSDFIKHDFLSKTRLAAGKVETLYIGVDLAKYETSAFAAAENVLKKEYRLKADAILVGLVGRIDTAKGQDTLICAAQEVVQTLKARNSPVLDKVAFFIVGSSEKGAGVEYENTLKQLVKDCGVADRFYFTGFRDDVPAVMNSLDIAVFPSKDESFGLVVIEAMAMRKAVVGSNRGAFPEIIVNGETGFVVENDAASLAAGIVPLLLDPNTRKLFGENGRKQVEKKFDLEMTIRGLLRLYAP
jgi:glycosyltransferase involved in cell wall biosynthesis